MSAGFSTVSSCFPFPRAALEMRITKASEHEGRRIGFHSLEWEDLHLLLGILLQQRHREQEFPDVLCSDPTGSLTKPTDLFSE